jgi:predicted metalloprotease with PDZ domain
MSKPSTHLFEVEIALKNLAEEHLDLIMPAWRTGRYVIFDFAGGVQEFSVTGFDGKSLPWTKIDKQTWRIETGGSRSITARYKVYANEFNSRTRGLNDEHAFADPASLFLYVNKYKHLPLELKVVPFAEWHVTTGLDPSPKEKNLFTAPNYEYFADCPMEIGNQKDFEFEVEGKKHVLMIYGTGTWDEKKIISDIAKLVKANKEFWGALPYERYIFMLHVTPSAGGGTEHINSTIMGAHPFVFSNSDRYTGFLGLVSHEFFHTWNVKQLRPSGIQPYDFSKENYVKELWIAEGGTDYYGSLFLARNGFLSPERFLEQVAAGIQSERLRPGNRIQSAAESSFDAWVKFWRETQNSYNSEADYYEKGAQIFVCLDLEIRENSQNSASLDDVMRTMFQTYRLGAKGYTVEDFQKVAEQKAGKNLSAFFQDYVFGTKPLPWERSLGYAGLEVLPKDTVMKPWLGVQTTNTGNAVRVTRVVAGSPAYDAGLDVGDEILAMNGFKVRGNDLQQRVSEMKAGETVKITVFRDDKLRAIDVILQNQSVPSYKLAKTKNPSNLQRAIYETWLKAKW